ncbi:hypothetical protein [uncultured Aquimarina sp.]|uniref:hypothetical protein n=1 Tax=uncultured Aquimarina sp. TaxID=575652 RepID=UPI0026297E5A|nr:hypothetical protein [uncultured Aquimarina sp.]
MIRKDVKKTLVGMLSLLICSLSFGQSFEGELTYKVEFDIKSQKIGSYEITKEQVIEKMKNDGEFYDTIKILIKNGNYIKKLNTRSEQKAIYKSDLNKIYSFQKDFDHVTITNANKFNSMNIDFKERKIQKIDSTKIINGISCKLIKLSWGKLAEEYYFYNTKTVKLNPQLFKKHNFEYLNEIIELSNSYPLEIIKTLNNSIKIKMTLIDISKELIDDKLFKLPEFEKAEKDYAEMMLEMGFEVMKIKN